MSGAGSLRRGAGVAHAECLIGLGAHDEAIERAELALRLAGEGGATERHAQGGAQGVLASAWSRKGDSARALEAAAKALEAVRLGSGAGYNFYGVVGMAEGSLSASDTEALAPPALVLARHACHTLRSYARRVPIAEPAAHLWQGHLDWALGRRARAQRAWRASAAAAERMGLRYDFARAHAALGRHLPEGDAERSRHLERAAAVFHEIGATWDAAITRSAS